MSEELRIIPLGGLGEIGKNMMVLEYGQDILIIDAGIMFPENDMLGIDLVIPDYRYLMDKLERVRAIIVTHGHEDHFGAIPYLLEKLQVPIYATRLTIGMLEPKLRAADREKARFHAIRDNDRIPIGPFQVEFFRVNHSVPDGVGLAIRTPVGLIVHSGDFKIDYTPVIDPPADLSRLACLGAEGVLALLSDSTNSESAGFTPSERSVQPAFDHVFSTVQGRVIIATFASHLPRIQQVLWAAERYGRKLAIAGRSIEENLRTGRELGYLDVPKGLLSSLQDLKSMPAEKTAILATGTQGEPTAAMGRMAKGTHRQIQIEAGDTVIVSAHPIPGNDEEVNDVINRLFQRGAQVIYDKIAPVHVSGHAAQEEQRLLLKLLQPQYFIPIHGELRHLHRHAHTAREMGLPPEKVLVVENGHVLHFSAEGGRVGTRVPGGYVFVDGSGIGDVGPAVLRDRELLSQDGFVVACIKLNRNTGIIADPPQITSRGFVYVRESDELFTQISDIITELFSQAGRYAGKEASADLLRDRLKHTIYQLTKRRPMIVPIVVEV